MLPAPFQGHPLQKRTEVQWDMRAWLHADGGANESMSPQLGISAPVKLSPEVPRARWPDRFGRCGDDHRSRRNGHCSHSLRPCGGVDPRRIAC